MNLRDLESFMSDLVFVAWWLAQGAAVVLLLWVVDQARMRKKAGTAARRSVWVLAGGWSRFRQSRTAVASAAALLSLYLVALFGEFFSPYDPRDPSYDLLAPPQWLHFFESGAFYARPFVYTLQRHLDPSSHHVTYEPNLSSKHPIYWFVRGAPYKMWGILNMDVHLFGLQDDQVFWHILGTDKLGRDVFSRLLYGGRVSLGIGLIGIAISLAVGRWLDSRAGYYTWVFGIPYLIVSEIWLSPMGMGLRPPVISWGTLIGLEIRAFPNLAVDVQGLAGPALAGAWTVLLFISIGRGLRRLAIAPASNRASGARKSGRQR